MIMVCSASSAKINGCGEERKAEQILSESHSIIKNVDPIKLKAISVGIEKMRIYKILSTLLKSL